MFRNQYDSKLSKTTKLLILFFIILISFALYAYRLFTLQIVQGEDYRSQSKVFSSQVKVLPAQRGEIFDRNANLPMVINTEHFVVSVTPGEIPSDRYDTVISKLAKLLDIPKSDIDVKIPKKRSYASVEVKSNVSFTTISNIAENKYDLPGVSWGSKPLRNYQHTKSLSHIVGYVGDISQEEFTLLYNKGYSKNSIVGKTGIEKQYDSLLQGTEGREMATVDVHGRILSDVPIIEPPKMGNNLVLTIDSRVQKLAEEDPTFTVKTDEQTGQTVISGMGELHLEIIIDRLKREFKVECNQGRPQVAYREAITQPVELREVYKKQSGGRGKFADIIVRVEPADEGFEGSLQFEDVVKGGNIPKEYIPAIEKGFQSAMKNGVLAGFPMDKLKVTVLDGSFHPVDSDQLSFEICAQIAFKNACAKAKPVLMEPIMKIEVVTPEESMGDVIGDLNKRRGQVEGMETARTGARIVKAKVPLSEMFGYVTALRTITSGRATSSMEFSHYAPVSSAIAKAVLTEAGGRADLV